MRPSIEPSWLRWLRVPIALIAAALAAPAPALGSSSATVFTAAGIESTAVGAPAPRCDSFDVCRIPSGWPPAWTAGARRLVPFCVSHMRDGTIVLCQGDQLIALGTDGRLRRLGPHLAVLDGVPISDIDAAADGSVLVLGEDQVVRVRVDGAVTPWAKLDGRYSGASAIAARADGGALVVGRGVEPGPDVTQIAPDGSVSTLIERLPRKYRHDLSDAADIAALPDGSFALAQSDQLRVLRLMPDKQVSVLAGGGRRFEPGAVATDVDLGFPDEVAARPDGAVLISSSEGLILVSPTARVSRLARVDATDETRVSANPRAYATTGARADRALLRPTAVDVLPDGEVTVLTDDPYGFSSWLALIAPLEQTQRFELALPPRDRAWPSHGRVEIVSTRPATGRIDIVDHGRVVRTRAVALVAGRNRIKLRTPHRSAPLVARLTATTSEGQSATVALPFRVGTSLGRSELRRLVRLVTHVEPRGFDGGISVSRCHRRSRRAFLCRSTIEAECCVDRGHVRFRVRRDGLVDVSLLDRRGRRESHWLSQPR